jgi:NTP pyrophosphatase (non-canonical NTP hydrolase)
MYLMRVANARRTRWMFSPQAGRHRTMEVALKELLKTLLEFRDDRDWGQFHTPKDLAISVSVEAAELLELFQWRSEKKLPDDDLIKAVSEEAADVFLYLLLLCDALRIDFIDAGQQELKKNQTRFPISNSKGIAKPEDRT